MDDMNAEVDDQPRRKLCEILETHGAAVCASPQRCEAFLRDLCAGHRREIFLLVAALKEHVVRDLLASNDCLPEEALVSKTTRKLCDNLGLAEESARWAVECWLFALRSVNITHIPPPVWPGTGFDPLGTGMSPNSTFPAVADAPAAKTARVDWAWLGLCLLAIVSVGVPLGMVTRIAFFSDGSSFRAWLLGTLWLAGGLAAGILGEYWAARQLQSRRPPRHRLLDPVKSSYALLVEVVVLITQPLALVGIPALWLGAWLGPWHPLGEPRDLAFHFGRIIQSLFIILFLWKWVDLMTSIQGKIATSMVRRR